MTRDEFLEICDKYKIKIFSVDYRSKKKEDLEKLIQILIEDLEDNDKELRT